MTSLTSRHRDGEAGPQSKLQTSNHLTLMDNDTMHYILLKQ